MIESLRFTLDTMQNAILDVKAQNTQLWERVRVLEAKQNENTLQFGVSKLTESNKDTPRALPRHSLVPVH